MKSLPFFSKWTRGSLAKFSYYFDQVKFKRHQFLFKEGDECLYVFIVISGEFEVLKRIANDYRKKPQFDMSEFLPQKRDKAFRNNVKNRRFISAVNSFKYKGAGDGTENIRVTLVGAGNLIGEDDAIKDRFHSTSVKCFSQEATLFRIKMENFHKFIRSTDEETWTKLEVNAMQKEMNVMKIMESKL